MGELLSDMSPLSLAVLLLSCLSLVKAQSCTDFTEGLCPLSEDNVVGSTNAQNVDECQNSCRNNTECNFFSYIASQCFLLASCNTTEPCSGCMSGPPSPPISDCQASTTTTMGTTTITTTTMGTTTVTSTTMGTTTMTTTTMGTTTTMETTLAPCDVTEGSLCDDDVITEITHINTASDCQAVCQNHPECQFWSHWREEGPEHWGTCWLHRTCGWTTDHDCGHRKQDCVHGAPFPDLDTCDDGQQHLPCEDDFFYGFTCQKGPENEIVHIEHMNSASDCQAVCQNHPECEYFSHSSRHNDCWLHYNCDKLEDHECREWEDTCVAGPKYPDIDDCSSPATSH